MANVLKLHDTTKENVQDIQLILRSSRDWEGSRCKKNSVGCDNTALTGTFVDDLVDHLDSQ